MRFFYRVTSPSDFVVTRLPYGKRPKRLPVVRSPEQVALLLATPKSPVVRMVLRTIYGTGMRVSEAVHLTIDQIDSRRMVVKVLGKGQKERLVPLSPKLLEELRAYWRQARPTQWMFAGKDPHQPLNATTVQKACKRACQAAGLVQRLLWCAVLELHYIAALAKAALVEDHHIAHLAVALDPLEHCR